MTGNAAEWVQLVVEFFASGFAAGIVVSVIRKG